MKKDILVSTIMSTYNEPIEWIEKSINSILNQSIKNLELIIICDNPSNEPLVKILNKYNSLDHRVKIEINDSNIGLTKSLNKAIKLASGKYIARMDSDDISEVNRFEKQLKYLEENNLDLIGGGVVCIDENDKKISILNNFPKNNDGVLRKIKFNNCIAHPSWFGKAKIFKSMNGYRDINYAEDYDFLLRALKSGYKLGNINEVVLSYRIRSSSISNKNGLKQFLTSMELVNFFKEDIILKNESVLNNRINKIFNTVKSEDEEKYFEASKLFTEGVFNIKRFNPIGIVLVLRAILKSKFYRKKIMCYLKGIV